MGGVKVWAHPTDIRGGIKKGFMVRNKNEWAAKVFALVKGGNVAAATAQIKVAPTVGDITRLQTLLAGLPPSPALRQLGAFVEEERALLAAPRLHRSP